MPDVDLPKAEHVLSVLRQARLSRNETAATMIAELVYEMAYIPLGVPRNEVRPTRIERRARLVNAIARGRRWLDEIVSSSATDIEQIATRQKCSVRQVNMTISLAFLAPVLVKAAVEGCLPRGIGVERLRDAPAEWSRQFEALGLNPQ